MRQEQKLVAGLLTVAVLMLLYFGLSRRPTRTAVVSDGHKKAPVVQGSQSDASNVLISTELYTMRQVNASIKHSDVPLHLSLVAVEPRKHIEARVPSVLLLHGHEQSAMLWEKLGTLQVLGDTGHRAYAVDLPGSGNTRLMGKLAPSDFIQAVVDYLELDRPLLVAPSSSGVFAFAYALEDPHSMQTRISGFIGLSPSHALAYRQEDFAHFKRVYAVLIYGTDNDLTGEEAYKRFRLIPSARVIPVESASHLHFVERPDIVNDIIIDALKALED